MSHPRATSPGATDIEVATILEAVPEFRDRYLALVEEFDDHPGAPGTLSELAEYVSDLAAGIDEYGPVLSRCFAAIEEIARTSDDAEELVGWSFLDYLSIDARRAVLPWVGPETLKILEVIEEP